MDIRSLKRVYPGVFRKLILPGLFLLLAVPRPLPAQELEPRALTNVPVGMNFIVMGYGYARGNILLDPSVPIEDLDSRLHSIFGAYVRAINLFGLASKMDIVLPFAAGDWEGLLEGEEQTRKIDGFGDPRIRLSVNFVGAPALKKSQVRNYHQSTIAGAIVQVFIPVGQYKASKLINPGTNRWTFRSQIGISHNLNGWIIEAYTGAWFFTRNDNFFGGLKLEQRPLFVGKLHLIRTLRNGMWFSFGTGYGIGGRTIIDDDVRDTRISSFRFGGVLAKPFANGHTLKLVVLSGVSLERGPDFDAVALSYQYLWGGS